CEQYRLNEVLAARLGRVRYGAQVTAVEQDDAGVTVSVNGAERLRALYLIGADGARSRVREALGIELEGFTWPERFLVASTPLYSVHQRVAQTYRRGRVFLAGDAAHLNNPLGGMGMNGGIHDAFNLAEKLAAVLRGEICEAELERYQRQRRPIALEYVNTVTIA